MKINYEFTAPEVEFIKKALIHSNNIRVTFCDNGAEDYPVEETMEFTEKVNSLCSYFDSKLPN